MSRPLLEGQIDDPLNSEIVKLRDNISELKVDLNLVTQERDAARSELDSIKKCAAEMMSRMFGAANLQWTGGDGAQVEAQTEQSNGRKAAVWEAWKQRLGGGKAKVIDALLLHGHMNTTQLAIATVLHRTTIPGVVAEL